MNPLPAWCSKSFLANERDAIITELKNPMNLASHAFSANIMADMNVAVSAAWAPATSAKYCRGVEAFHRFCDDQHVPHHLRLPADEFTLCAFAASHLRRTAGSTARGHLSAVRAWHIANNVPYAGQDSLRLRYTLKGVENLRPATSRMAIRSPVTRRLLELLEEDLDPCVPLDAAVLACATTAMWGQCRLGELLSSSQYKFERDRIPTWSGVGSSATPAGSRLLHLPWTKTSGAKGASVMLCRQRGGSDPIEALHRHKLVNKSDSSWPLFSYHSESGLICLTKRKMLQRCNEIWSRRGVPCLTGHSFRIGGTTELLIAGVPPHVVKMMGRWTSDAFLRPLERIAPLYAEHLQFPASSFG